MTWYIGLGESKRHPTKSVTPGFDRFQGVLGKLGPWQIGPRAIFVANWAPAYCAPAYCAPANGAPGRLGPWKILGAANWAPENLLVANWAPANRAPANRAPADWAPWRQIGGHVYNRHKGQFSPDRIWSTMDHACAIFLESTGYRDVRYDVPRCLTCIYTNANT